MEDTTISLAISPVSRAPAACQVPKPRGVERGAMAVPISRSRLSDACSAMRKPGPKDWRNQSSTLMARISVPAFTRKPRTLSHTWSRMFFRVGSR